MTEDWKSWAVRQRIIQQIDQHLRLAPSAANKNAQELEETMFRRSEKKEDYMTYVSRLIMHLKQTATSSQNPSPMSAMLTNQGGQAIVGQMNQMGGTAAGTGQIISGPNNANMMPGQQITMQTSARMPQPMPASFAQNQSGDMISYQNTNQRLNEMHMANMGGPKQVSIGNTMPINGPPNKMTQIQMPHGPVIGIPPGSMPRQVSGIQMRVPSPGFQAAPIGGPRQTTSAPTNVASMSTINQQQTSPAFISPSPSNMVPSPVGANAGVCSGRPGNLLGVQSPGSVMINTPGQPVDQQQSVDDKAYTEKVRQLQKYIEPLRKAIRHHGSEEAEKTGKMKKLLEMLQNPGQRMSMEILRRCELVLMQLDIPRDKPEVEAPAPPSTKENPFQVLVEAVKLAHKSPRGAHTIHRTLSPALNTLLGPSIMPNNLKKFKSDDTFQSPVDKPVISNLIKGEVARLPARFKVNVDCQQPAANDDLTLSCQLDDPHMPCVPPITLIIPPDYPEHPPRCLLQKVDYETTDFLKRVREVMISRQHHLPSSCTISMMLDTWEMSIRQACPSRTFADATSSIAAMISAPY